MALTIEAAAMARVPLAGTDWVPGRDGGSGTMRAMAHRRDGFRHEIDVRDHHFAVDEPVETGGADTGPSPGTARGEPGVLHGGHQVGDVRQTQGLGRRWTRGRVRGVYLSPAERGCPTRFSLVLRFPPTLTAVQVEKLQVVATKCPVHRALEGEAMFDERAERLALSA